MISCKGMLRNGEKYAKLAYLLPISGNSGVQKHMAFGGGETRCAFNYNKQRGVLPGL
jgi:hypothetical protein